MAYNNRFLIIDDVRDNLITLKALILEVFPNADVVVTQSGERGINLARETEPDVILLDILMPKMDGFEVCSRIQGDPKCEGIPILFITALKSDKGNRMKALHSGGEAFLTKPVDEVELYVQLRSMLKIREKNRLEKAKTEKLNEKVMERTVELEGLKEKYKNLLEDLPALICEYLPDSTLTYVNQAYCEYHNQSSEELIGKKFLDLLSKNQREKVKRSYLFLSPDGPLNTSTEQREINGEENWLEWRNRAIFDNEGQIMQYYSIGLDVTQRKKAEQNLVFLSYHDHLTGLYNRRFFEEELKRLDQSRNLPLTIVMADVNGLKIVNDSFGHLAGDQLLKRVADAMRIGFRADDIIARIGGDEFAMILLKTDETTADRIVKRAKENVKLLSKGNALQSVSFGFHTKTLPTENINEVFAQAENFMYRHKIYESASMRSKVVELVMNSLFEKSQREMSHSRRVGEIAASIAKEMDFSEEHIMEIRTTGCIHDIGKIGVQEKILNKDGKLTSDEWSEIKQHPEAGRRILSSIDDFKVIAEYIQAHHERWDGKGYPDGISGNQIPIESRIISVADAYDAMTSERSYRESMGREVAVEEIKKNSGSQFDPAVVEAFLAIEMPDDWNVQLYDHDFISFDV
jgi:diguanylate cyclase (GGDEF)-like protein/PAS domain S-box-containing protein